MEVGREEVGREEMDFDLGFGSAKVGGLERWGLRWRGCLQSLSQVISGRRKSSPVMEL